MSDIMDVHAIRGSDRRARRICLEYWNWRWRQRYVPIIGEQAMEFGSGFHAGMEALYNPATWELTTPTEKLANAIEAFETCCDAQRDAYLLATSQTRLTKDGRDDYASRVELGRKMLEHYVLHVHPKEDVGLKPRKVEIQFSVPLLDEDGTPVRCFDSPHCGQVHSHGAPVHLTGQIDVIMEDTIRGGYYILDWKTCGGDEALNSASPKQTGRFSRPDMVPNNDQFCTYCYITRYLLNLDVRGFILAEIRKDYPKPPARLKRKSNGGIYSQDKGMATSVDIYRATVVEGDPEGYNDGAYDKFLYWLANDKDAPRFHQRIRVEKTREQLKVIGRNLLLEVKAMLRPDQEIYPNVSVFGCPRCAFKAPCDMKMSGFDYRQTLASLYAKDDS